MFKILNIKCFQNIFKNFINKIILSDVFQYMYYNHLFALVYMTMNIPLTYSLYMFLFSLSSSHLVTIIVVHTLFYRVVAWLNGFNIQLWRIDILYQKTSSGILFFVLLTATIAASLYFGLDPDGQPNMSSDSEPSVWYYDELVGPTKSIEPLKEMIEPITTPNVNVDVVTAVTNSDETSSKEGPVLCPPVSDANSNNNSINAGNTDVNNNSINSNKDLSKLNLKTYNVADYIGKTSVNSQVCKRGMAAGDLNSPLMKEANLSQNQQMILRRSIFKESIAGAKAALERINTSGLSIEDALGKINEKYDSEDGNGNYVSGLDTPKEQLKRVEQADGFTREAYTQTLMQVVDATETMAKRLGAEASNINNNNNSVAAVSTNTAVASPYLSISKDVGIHNIPSTPITAPLLPEQVTMPVPTSNLVNNNNNVDSSAAAVMTVPTTTILDIKQADALVLDSFLDTTDSNNSKDFNYSYKPIILNLTGVGGDTSNAPLTISNNSLDKAAVTSSVTTPNLIQSEGASIHETNQTTTNSKNNNTDSNNSTTLVVTATLTDSGVGPSDSGLDSDEEKKFEELFLKLIDNGEFSELVKNLTKSKK